MAILGFSAHGGGKNPRFAPVMINLKDDGGKKAGFAHVNPMSYADFHLLSNTLNLFWEHRKR